MEKKENNVTGVKEKLMGNIYDALIDINRMKQKRKAYEKMSSLWLRETNKQKCQSSDKQDDVKKEQKNKNKHKQSSKINHK